MFRTFLLRRLALTAVLFVAVTFVVFMLTRLSGDPAVLILGTNTTTEQIEGLRAELGLDQPVVLQYLSFVGNAVQGDIGQSLYYQEDAMSLVLSRFPATLLLSGTAMVIAILVAMPLGAWAALRPNSIGDYLGKLIFGVGMGFPAYWIGIMLILLFSVRLQLFPAGGYGGLAELVLPAVTLALWPMARIGRVFRSSLTEVLHQDYVVMARAKGLPKRRVFMAHIVRNALIPVTTAVALTLGVILGGTVVTEVVFSWPGMGRLALDAVSQRDFPVVQGVVLFGAAIFLVINLLIDLVTALLDPRVRLQ